MNREIQEYLKPVNDRLDRHDIRISSLERLVDVIELKLDQVVKLLEGISTTIRNTLVVAAIGGIAWAIIQAGIF